MFIDLKNTFIKKCSAIVNNHLLFSAQILMTSSNAKFLTQSTGSNQPRLPRRPILSSKYDLGAAQFKLKIRDKTESRILLTVNACHFY
jgi:hypothetical protein